MFGRFSKKKKTSSADAETLAGVAYVIGDIHGCFDELLELLDLIKEDILAEGPGPKYIVFLGDLMDRGPKSFEVIDYLSKYAPDFATPIYLMGNHEEVFLKVLSGSTGALSSWFEFGGRSCVRSYGVENLGEILISPDNLLFRIQDKVPKSHINFIESFQETFQFGPYLCVHAGIKPRVAIEKQSTRDLRWIRKEFIKYTKQHPFIIVHGHTIVGDVPEIHSNRIAVDTGTYDGGPLTAVKLSSEAPLFLQSSSSRPES